GGLTSDPCRGGFQEPRRADTRAAPRGGPLSFREDAMQDRLESLASKARKEIAGAQDASGLEALRVRYLGKKGELSAVLGGMGKLAADERRRVGEIANRVKDEVEGLLGEAQRRIAHAALEAELQAPPIDVTLPGRMRRPGRRHVVSRTMEEITRTFQRL